MVYFLLENTIYQINCEDTDKVTRLITLNCSFAFRKINHTHASYNEVPYLKF